MEREEEEELRNTIEAIACRASHDVTGELSPQFVSQIRLGHLQVMIHEPHKPHQDL
jgi:hypothetical protein